ncbi:MAG TPA: hypothetical protein VGL81_01325 [Polyangiaceae bacterium]|nr:hypothetical protein [Polyangiaceae bacterium]
MRKQDLGKLTPGSMNLPELIKKKRGVSKRGRPGKHTFPVGGPPEEGPS